MYKHPKGWLLEEQLTQSAIGAFFAVHKALGFGFLESVYSRALQVELEYRGHHVVREYPITIMCRGVEVGRHRLDLLVDNKLVLESKATEQLPRDFTRQLYNYLKATPFEVGLFLHFGRRADFYRIVYQNDEKEQHVGRQRPDRKRGRMSGGPTSRATSAGTPSAPRSLV